MLRCQLSEAVNDKSGRDLQHAAATARNSRGPWLVSPDQRRMGLTPKLWPSLGQESCHFTQQQDSGRQDAPCVVFK